MHHHMGLDAGYHDRRIERFDDIVIGTQGQPSDLVFVTAAGCHKNDGNIVFFTDGTAQVKAVYIGQVDVEDDGIDSHLFQCPESRPAFAGHRDFKSIVLQKIPLQRGN